MKRLLPVLVCAASFAGDVAAQNPRLPSAHPVTAEPAFTPGRWLFSATVGGAAFTDFQRTQARPTVEDMPMADFERRISAGTSISLGTALTWWASRTVGVRAAASWVPTRFSVSNEADTDRTLNRMGYEQEPRQAALRVLMGDVALLFRFPHTVERVVPYGIVGAGYVHYTVTEDTRVPPEAQQRFASGGVGEPAAVFGLGLGIPMQRPGMLLNFELTNHLAHTPLDDAGHGARFDVGGMPMQLAPDAEGTDGVSLTNHIRLSLAFTVVLH